VRRSRIARREGWETAPRALLKVSMATFNQKVE